MSRIKVDTMYPNWRDQTIGHSLRAGELLLTDCAALLEDTASGGYPHKVGEDRVAVRIAIVARAAELLRVGDELLALARRYASECAECGGRGIRGPGYVEGGVVTIPSCQECAEIRAVIERATK
jgi:hypothetical protein